MHKLVIFDMDGTIFAHKNFWLELHKRLGTWNEGKQATEEWLHKDFGKLIDIVIHNLWKGKPAQPYLDLVAEAEYLPGVKEAVKDLRARGYTIAIITSGPSLLMERAKKELGIDLGVASVLEVKDGAITGRSRHDDGSPMFLEEENDKAHDAELLCRKLGITLKDAVAVGDGRNDIPLFKAVGMSIAFNTKNDDVRKAATHHVEGNDLRKILGHF